MRLPDKPGREISRDSLVIYERFKSYFCTLKWDGWRCIAKCRRGTLRPCITYTSCSGKPLTPAPEAVEAFERAVREQLRDTESFTLDCELIGNRRAGEAKKIVVLEAIEWDGYYWYTAAAIHRYNMAAARFPAFKTPAVTRDFTQFYDEWQAKEPLAEGVVLKGIDSPVLYLEEKNNKNPQWVKCKWRAGESGTTPTEGP